MFGALGVSATVLANGSWRPLPPLPDAHRANSVATRLPDDRVLVAGGFGECFEVALSAEAFRLELSREEKGALITTVVPVIILDD